jgi:acyl carrier protein
MKPQPLDSGTDASIAPTPSLRERIAGVFSQKLHIEVPSIETDLMETGVLDSLTLVELLFHIEQELGLKISLETLELDHFRSIARIADYLSSQNGVHRNGGGAR